jgi:Flp pilus assembly protein TadG
MSLREKNRLQRGQDLMEYALVLPIMLLILMSILDLGRVVYVYSSLHNSVRDGARYGIISPTDATGIQSVVLDKAVGLDPADLVISVVQPSPETIQVGATYEFTAVSPIVAALIGGNPWEVGSQSTMRVEG